MSRGRHKKNQASKRRGRARSGGGGKGGGTAASMQPEERIEGRNALTEALNAGRKIKEVWYLDSADQNKADRRLQEILQRLRAEGAVLHPTERRRLDEMAATFSHQGIIAQAEPRRYAEISEMLALAEARDEAPFLILLDRIQDSGNLGAILRTADAAGAHGVIIPKRRSACLDAVAAKASAGAVEYVLCAQVTNLNQTIIELKEQNIWVAGLGMGGDNIFSSDMLQLPLALVIGNEGEGLSRSAEKHCDFILGIPQRGKINSLNASAAAAVAMYEVLRQREAAAD